MKKEWTEQLRWWMLRSQRIPPVNSAYRNLSEIIMRVAGRRLARVPGVAGVFSRHTHPRSPAFVPGHSDVDLTVVLDDHFAHDPHCIRECSTTIHQLGRRFLFTKAEDARFLSESELSRLTRTFCSPFELLARPEDWLLIAGREVRVQKSLPFAPALVPTHAEFNRWWEHVLQTQFFRPSGESDRGYMRAVYRSALKNQLHLEAARGFASAGAERHGPDELAGLKFDENPELHEILARIKKQNLWVDSPRERTTELFWHVLKAAERFFSRGGRPPGAAAPVPHRSANTSNVGSSALSDSINDHEPHMRVYEALRKMLNDVPGVAAVLKSAVAYPLPHAFPYIYRIDLVLHEELAQRGFASVCDALAEVLGKKSFAVCGVPVEFTLIPHAIYRQPLFYLGSGSPFLLEHINRFGFTVHGSDRCYPAVPWTAADSRLWCRTYLPYHMVTFRRRLEYGSPVLNFCQLASLEIYLATGEKLTETAAVRRRYESEFVQGGEDREVVDSLFSYPNDPRHGVVYDKALAFVSRTYDRLESSLAGSLRHD